MKKRILVAAVLVGICSAVPDISAAPRNHGKSAPRPNSSHVQQAPSFRKPASPIPTRPPQPASYRGGYQAATNRPAISRGPGNGSVRPGVGSGMPTAKLPQPNKQVGKTVSTQATRGYSVQFKGGDPPSFTPPPPPTVPNIISGAQNAVQTVQSAGQNGINYVAGRLPSMGGSGVSFGPSSTAGHTVSGLSNGQVLGTSAPPTSISRPTIQVDNAISTTTTRPPSVAQVFGGNQPKTPNTPTLTQVFGGNQPKTPSLPTLNKAGQTLQKPQTWSQAGQPIIFPNPITAAQGAQSRGGDWWNKHVRDPWVRAVDAPGEWLKKGQEAGQKSDARMADEASRMPDGYTGDQYTSQQTVQISQSQYGANAISVSAPNGGSVGYPINPAMEGKQVTITMYVVGDPSKVNLAVSSDKGSIVASAPPTTGTVKTVPINGQLVPVHEIQFNVKVPSDGKGWGGMNSTGDFNATLQIQPGAQIDILLETAKRSN